MAKKITPILFILLCLGGLYAGFYVYRSLQNTPERRAEQFVQTIKAGEVDRAYALLTPQLAVGREAYWRDYLSHFEPGGKSSLVAHEQLKNSLNTYAEHADPQRFTYQLKRGGQDYRLNVVVVKVGKQWRVAELYGAASTP
jgi:hypothetical protein